MDDTSLRNFAIDGADRNVQDVVSKLRFLSKIKKGEKINVATLTLSEDNWINNFHRCISAIESREMSLDFIKRVIMGYPVISSASSNGALV